MRDFLLLLLIGAAAAGYYFRDDIELAWYQWQTTGDYSVTDSMGSFGRSVGGQLQGFGSAIDSLNK